MPEDNGKQNPDDSCWSKYQKHVAHSYGYKLWCVDNKFDDDDDDDDDDGDELFLWYGWPTKGV